MHTAFLLLALTLPQVTDAEVVRGAHQTPEELSESGIDSSQEESQSPWLFGGWGESQLMFSLGKTRETDPGGERLDGLTVSAGVWDETDDESGGIRFFFWGNLREGETQQVVGLGGDLGVVILPLGPVRFYPHLKVGVEHRQEDPHEGVNGVVGIGLEFALWMGKHCQIAFAADRDFGFPSGARNQVGLSLRWGYVRRGLRVIKAAETGDINEVRRLLEKGATASASGPYGHTAIEAATNKCDLELMELLVTHGADVAGSQGERALWTAVRRCSPEAASLLLLSGADPNHESWCGTTLLMDAVELQRQEMVEILLASGANPNARFGCTDQPFEQEPGQDHTPPEEAECQATALMLAVESENADIVHLLLESGADSRFVDRYGCTALKLAREKGNVDIIELLQQAQTHE